MTITNSLALCEICGEPLPAGEEMFKFHGFTSDCPKPPKEKITSRVVVEYFMLERADGWWVVTHVDKRPHDDIGPFDSKEECERCYDDLLESMRQLGAKDVKAQ